MISARSGINGEGLRCLVAELIRRAGTRELDVVEVGSFRGESAVIFAQHFRSVTCVDPWDQATMNIKNVSAREAEVDFDARIKPFVNIVKHKGYSVSVAAVMILRMFDVVYIDALHDYEHVAQDIRAWRPRCRRFMTGHDYNARHFKGVIAAVDELLGKPMVFADHSWLVEVSG